MIVPSPLQSGQSTSLPPVSTLEYPPLILNNFFCPLQRKHRFLIDDISNPSQSEYTINTFILTHLFTKSVDKFVDMASQYKLIRSYRHRSVLNQNDICRYFIDIVGKRRYYIHVKQRNSNQAEITIGAKMIIEKSHDTDVMHQDLSEAINCALELNDPIGLWVQKYQDNCDDYWEVSVTDKSIGIHVLSHLELSGFIAAIQQFNESEDFTFLHNIISVTVAMIMERWNEKKTIDITTTSYQDYCDMYGVNCLDFA